MGVVLAGSDGSEAAMAAVEFAVEEAEMRRATLRVVSVWEMPAPPEGGATEKWEELISERRAAAEDIVSEAVARARELRPQIEAEGATLTGSAAKVLVEEAREAAAVVLGRRGKGFLGGHALGSVSRYVADHAACPVIVVPPRPKA